MSKTGMPTSTPKEELHTRSFQFPVRIDATRKIRVCPNVVESAMIKAIRVRVLKLFHLVFSGHLGHQTIS